MKKFLLLIFLSIVSFNVIHADITWKLSDDGTLTISGTNMPDYYSESNASSSAPWSSLREKIKKVVIKNGVTNIGSGAFFICNYITSVTIPNSVKSIGATAFAGCSSLTSITIPNSVTTIGWSAFASCRNLTSITLSESLTSIEGGSFNSCTKLASITIPNSVKSIGVTAFAYCTNLTSVTIPNSVTTIERAAFRNCSKLTSVTIPNSVTTIGQSVFAYCSALTSVTNLSTTPQKITDGTFTNYGTLHVLPGCKAAYKTADYWKNFTIIEDAKGSGTTEVADVEVNNGIKDGKYLIDGKVVIVRNGKKYNLNGIAE